MNKSTLILLISTFIFIGSCKPPPPPDKKVVHEKHNYIILLDLSDRIIVQDNQPERDKEIIRHLYGLFENKVKKDLYIKSRDEIKVVIAPQKGSELPTYIFEDRMYVNINNINNVFRRKQEEKRRNEFFANLDTLYQEAEFSKIPSEYYGADIWKYFYEDLKDDYVKDTITKNFLFILTDGYPIVGKDKEKLQPLKDKFPDLHVVLIEAAPREEDMEWDRVINLWEEWFNEIGIKDYTLIKRKAISKEKEQLTDIVSVEEE
ncbi:MAG: hypothetical protein JXJ22_13145 [Bacteroidales bacterium]|nr:hypothetical protein [Bacteroidales bacterium]